MTINKIEGFLSERVTVMDMKIAGANNVYGVYDAHNRQNVKKTGLSVKPDSGKDAFSLSAQAEDFQAVRKAFANIPDVRADKVVQMKKAFDTGVYAVISSDIADKILEQQL